MRSTADRASTSLFRDRARTRTPTATLRVRVGLETHPLSLKLEGHNPTGSIKYRTAVGLIAALDEAGPLLPGTTVAESTSGNLGIALAAVLKEMACRFVAVVDPHVPRAVREAIARHGGEIVEVDERDPHGGYLMSRLATLHAMLEHDEQLRWTDQYTSRANPEIHRDTIAEELIAQTAGAVDAVLVPVSTGGTLAGISDGLRAGSSQAAIYAVDVVGSLVTSDVARPHLLTGIGATRKSSFLQSSHYDQALRVQDVAAFAMCRRLCRETGLAIGGSGGAVVTAYVNAVAIGGPVRLASCPVAVIADGGEKYAATFYDDSWLAAHGVLDSVELADVALSRAGVAFELGETIDG